MVPPDPVLVITGASGYIGRALVARALAAGWHVQVLTRRPVIGLAVEAWAAFDLAQPLGIAAKSMLAGASAVVHLAGDTKAEALDDAAEVGAGLAIMDAIRPGTPVIIVSSQAAQSGAPSAYGRRKAALERALAPRGATLARPGLVYGGQPRGLYGTLCRLVDRSPVLPRLWPEPMVRPVHVDDLCSALLALAEAKEAPGRPIGIAQPDPVPFSSVLRFIGEGRGLAPVFAPMPTLLARLAARLLPRRTGAQLASLLTLPPLPDDGGLTRAGLELDAISARRCVWPPTQRRRLLTEAAVLTTHVSGARPSTLALKLYVRGCAVQGLAPLPGGWVVLWLSVRFNDAPLLRAVAASHPRGAGVQQRLRIAMAVAEVCPALADRFFWPPSGGRGRALAAIAMTVAGEGLRLALAAPWLVTRALVQRLRP